ncbi:hypothetical protein MRB53_023922 [Persea americana]|uniref:Uncharacterized protein n=1 Tax=Persea americana TaxID=3435 RepID=A0ACC2LC35_PERAE|nr:hypothetical protein MRB53_023922 [Persea americana]
MGSANPDLTRSDRGSCATPSPAKSLAPPSSSPPMTENETQSGRTDPIFSDENQGKHKMEEQLQLPISIAMGPNPPVAAGGWRSAIFIIWVEVAERFAYYGIAGNLITYLTKVMGEPTVTAARNVNVWSGVSTILPVVGAFVADAYLGRYDTILYSSLIYILISSPSPSLCSQGLVLLTVAVAITQRQFKEPLLFISLYLIAIGQGGHKPCVQAFGADQFQEESEEERRTKNSFFNWWYLAICGGGVAAMLIIFYIQDNVGWTIGYCILSIVMASSLVFFLLGRRLYQRQALSGSSLTRVAQVLVAAARKSHLPSTMNNILLEEEDTAFDRESRPLTRTKQFRFLDKASFIDEIDASHEIKNKWRLCSTAQVEEVKMLIRLVPIWVSCLMYAVVFAQPNTFFIKQGSTLDRNIGTFVVPSASLLVAVGLTAAVAVFIYDRFIVPIARKITGTSSGLTMLQRIGVGIFLSVIMMMAAALVERRRLKIVREFGLVDRPNASVPMSVWWLLPQYMILGVADVFTLVGLQQFFYDQMPDGLRSIGAAAYLCIMGVGSFISGGIISIVGNSSGWLVDNLNSAHLDYFYWLLTGLSALWFGLFLVLSRQYIYKQVADALP